MNFIVAYFEINRHYLIDDCKLALLNEFCIRNLSTQLILIHQF